MPSPIPYLVDTYDYRLVTLSVVISILAAYAGLDLAGRVNAAHGLPKFAWLNGDVLQMGIGIWSTHCIGVEAIRLPTRCRCPR